MSCTLRVRQSFLVRVGEAGHGSFLLTKSRFLRDTFYLTLFSTEFWLLLTPRLPRVFGRPLDMITQDSLRFYNSHAVYDNFGGIVLDREEGIRIATCLGNGKAAILQNHGLLTVGQ